MVQEAFSGTKLPGGIFPDPSSKGQRGLRCYNPHSPKMLPWSFLPLGSSLLPFLPFLPFLCFLCLSLSELLKGWASLTAVEEWHASRPTEQPAERRHRRRFIDAHCDGLGFRLCGAAKTSAWKSAPKNCPSPALPYEPAGQPPRFCE